jgi:hypothetical protein
MLHILPISSFLSWSFKFYLVESLFSEIKQINVINCDVGDAALI